MDNGFDNNIRVNTSRFGLTKDQGYEYQICHQLAGGTGFPFERGGGGGGGHSGTNNKSVTSRRYTN